MISTWSVRASRFLIRVSPQMRRIAPKRILPPSERDERLPAGNERFVDDGKLGAGSEVGAEDAGVDDDWAGEEVGRSHLSNRSPDASCLRHP